MLKKVALCIMVLLCTCSVYAFKGGTGQMLGANPIWSGLLSGANITASGYGTFGSYVTVGTYETIGTYLRVGTTLDVAGCQTNVSSVTVRTSGGLGSVQIVGNQGAVIDLASCTLGSKATNYYTYMNSTNYWNGAGLVRSDGFTCGNDKLVTSGGYRGDSGLGELDLYGTNGVISLNGANDVTAILDSLQVKPGGTTQAFEVNLASSGASNNFVVGQHLSANTISVSTMGVTGNGGLSVTDQTNTQYCNVSSTWILNGSGKINGDITSNVACSANISAVSFRGYTDIDIVTLGGGVKDVLARGPNNKNMQFSAQGSGNTWIGVKPTTFTTSSGDVAMPNNLSVSQTATADNIVCSSMTIKAPAGQGSIGTDYAVNVSSQNGTSVAHIDNDGNMTVAGFMQLASHTEAELKLITPTVAGQLYYDSTNKSVIVSTGTAQAAFAKIDDGTQPTGW